MTWLPFASVFALFFLSHSIPVRPAIKSRVVTRIGARGFTLAYSALSLAMLVWLIRAAGRAPFVVLWYPVPWHTYAALAGMLAVCVILALAIGRPNPFSFGGARAHTFDAQHPGIVRWMRHPMLVALALWAGMHLMPNGDLAHVILFGIFAAFAILGRRIIDRRQRRLMGAETWERMRDAVARAPRFRRPGVETIIRVAAGVALYLTLLALHPLVIGVSPLP
jgi:uncharacterized membrane protein